MPERYGISVALADAAPTPAVSVTRLEPLANVETLKPRRPKYAAMLPLPSIELSMPEEDESAYLPRKRLTVPPRALREIEVPYPAKAARSEPISIRLALFINSDGSVTDARVVTPFIPPEFAYAARQTFLEAKFRPGEVDGVAVKSRMVVEVSFSSNDDGKTR
jgi:TonB family protein